MFIGEILVSESADLISSNSLFQSFGTLTENVMSALIFSRVSETHE